MDLVFCRSDGSHVPVDTVHPSLLPSSSLSSPRWYHLQSLSSDVFLVSPIDMAKPPQARFPVPLCDVLYFYPWCHRFSHGLLVCGRMPTCTSSFLSPRISTHGSYGTVSILYSIAGWTIIFWIFPFTCGGTLLSHRTPDIFLQLFHPHCVLLFNSVFISPSITVASSHPWVQFFSSGNFTQLIWIVDVAEGLMIDKWKLNCIPVIRNWMDAQSILIIYGFTKLIWIIPETQTQYRALGVIFVYRQGQNLLLWQSLSVNQELVYQ